MSTAIDISTIILSVVAIIVTLVGFFASLRFYRDGMELQSRAQGLLSRIEEKVGSLQSQVGGLLNKTVDAMIDRRPLSETAQAQDALLVEAASSRDAGASTDEEDNLARDVMDLFAFRGFFMSDVTTGDGAAVFALGSSFRFNLFDAPQKIVFLGYFPQARVLPLTSWTRFLLENIGTAYGKIERAEAEKAQQRWATELFDMISVTLVIPEEVDRVALAGVIARYQPTVRTIEVEYLSPSEVREQLDGLRQDMM